MTIWISVLEWLHFANLSKEGFRSATDLLVVQENQTGISAQIHFVLWLHLATIHKTKNLKYGLLVRKAGQIALAYQVWVSLYFRYFVVTSHHIGIMHRSYATMNQQGTQGKCTSSTRNMWPTHSHHVSRTHKSCVWGGARKLPVNPQQSNARLKISTNAHKGYHREVWWDRGQSCTPWIPDMIISHKDSCLTILRGRAPCVSTCSTMVKIKFELCMFACLLAICEGKICKFFSYAWRLSIEISKWKQSLELCVPNRIGDLETFCVSRKNTDKRNQQKLSW